MPSTRSKLFTALLKIINKKRFLERQLDANKFDSYSCPEPPSGISKTFHLQKSQINDRNVFTLSPKNRNSNKHVFYLHGGAYVQCFNRFHWSFLAELVTTANCIITTPDYPLAPRFTYKESFAMVTTCYEQLAARGDSKDLTIMGDSSGGGFALALAQKIRDEHKKKPGQIILLSPWLDITLTNPAIKDIELIDPFLEKESLQRAGKLYAGDTRPDHHLLSPINGSLEGLGKISVFVGSKEILLPDAKKLYRLGQSKGIEINYHEYAGMFHGWMFLNFPESKKAKREIADLINKFPPVVL